MNILKTAKSILSNNRGWIPAAIGAAGAIGSSLLSAGAVEAAAKRQIDWERERAKNAHQWEVEDLKKAGLNPILSAGGSGATTGGISAPVPDTSGYAQAGEMILNAFFKKKELNNQTKLADAETENKLADVELKNNQSALTTAQTATELERKGLISKQQASEVAEQSLKYAQANKTDAETKIMLSKMELEIEVLKQQIKLADAEGKLKEKEALVKELERKYYTVNTIMQNLERGSKTLQNSAQAVNNVLEIVPAKKAIGFLAK